MIDECMQNFWANCFRLRTRTVHWVFGHCCGATHWRKFGLLCGGSAVWYQCTAVLCGSSAHCWRKVRLCGATNTPEKSMDQHTGRPTFKLDALWIKQMWPLVILTLHPYSHVKVQLNMIVFCCELWTPQKQDQCQKTLVEIEEIPKSPN